MGHTRLTGYAHGGGCACKIPPGELEEAVRGLIGQPSDDVLVGLDDGDDAAAVRVGDIAVLSTADFFTPVVDDAYDWGRIAAANALSDVYAMGGRPVVAINLVGWPRDVLPLELMTEVLRGGLAVASEAGCPVIGGHSIDDPEPKYGMAVTGVADPAQLLRNDAAEPGLPLTLTKPLGVGLLNNRHKQTGEVFEDAIAIMTQLNRDAAEAALSAGVRAATDVTGFGLLGHLYKMCRASGVGAIVDRAAVPVIESAREALRDGFVSGGTRRNLDWVRPQLRWAPDVSEDDLL
ncbi:MAG TPA: selenide, water dikinase SelD, partial [Mycobacterium sp.]|nr:selenide, water dikinase SelD [Mycobacterium sp.]